MENFKSKVAVWGLWILILLLFVSLVKNFSRNKQISLQIEAEKAKVARMEAENKKLQDQIAEAQSPEFVEKQVRDKLGLGKEGEAIVVLPDEDALRKLAPVIKEETDTLPDPTWRKWIKLFL